MSSPTAPAQPPDEDPFARWGTPCRHRLGARAHAFLDAEVGPGPDAEVGPGPARPSAASPGPVAAPSRLAAPARDALRRAVGGDHVHESAAERLRYAGGASYTDLVRRRSARVQVPDAVVRPGTHAEVAAVLAACSTHHVAVVPFGGGTSVVGGVEPLAGRFGAVVTVDLRRLDRFDLDPVSGTVTVGPGMRVCDLERLLVADDRTLGHLPQSFERLTIGGAVATRSAGQASTGYGGIDDMVVSLRVATPAGDLRLGRAPASAAGPDLRALFVGSEGVLGVVTEVTLRIRPRPRYLRYEGWVLPDLGSGLDALRALAQSGRTPEVARLSDPDETRATLAMSGPGGHVGRLLSGYLSRRGYGAGCLVVLGWEGDRREVRARRADGVRLLRRHRALRLGRRVGAAWRRHRFDGPYLRDELLDVGVLVETLETAASWSRLPEVYAAVRAALATAWRGRPPFVMTHVSHLYRDGASLYVTVLGRPEPGEEVVQWEAAKRAATDALVGAGGTLSHHHAVGADHRPWMAAEVGDLGVEVLRAVKGVVDPEGVLNPGKLLPDP